MAASFFDKYGGFGSFQKITRDFYVKVLDSKRLRPFFDGVDMENLIEHQARFLSRLLGGPRDQFAEVDLREVHAELAIAEPDFIEVSELLTETLEDAGIESADLEAILEVVSEFKHQMVGA